MPWIGGGIAVGAACLENDIKGPGAPAGFSTFPEVAIRDGRGELVDDRPILRRRRTTSPRPTNDISRLNAIAAHLRSCEGRGQASRRIGEANRPGPNTQHRHNTLLPQSTLSDEQYYHFNCVKAGIARTKSEQRVEQVTRAFQEVEGLTKQALDRKPTKLSDPVEGPKPNPPTSIGALLGKVELSVSTIKFATVDGHKDILTGTKGLTAIQEQQTPTAIHEPMVNHLKKHGIDLVLGYLCMTTGHSSAGVGSQHDHSITTSRIDINAQFSPRGRTSKEGLPL